MSSSMRHRSALIAAVTVLLACEVERTPRPAVIDADSAARADIRATLDAYHDALLDGDATRAAAFFTDDGRLYQPEAPDVVGAAAVRDALSGYFRTGAIMSIALDRGSIDMVRGGGAYEMGRYAETFRPVDGSEQTVRARYAIRWRRGADGGWVIHTFMLNHYPADTSVTR